MELFLHHNEEGKTPCNISGLSPKVLKMTICTRHHFLAVLDASSLPACPCELVDEAESLLLGLLQLFHAGKRNGLVVLMCLIIRTDFKMSRNLRDVDHVPRIHGGEQVTELPDLVSNQRGIKHRG